MLKYEGIAKVGDKIRAYDFEPLYPRPARYIEGVVKQVIDESHPDFKNLHYFAYHVTVTKDTLGEGEHSRVNYEVLVPMETSMDYIGRIVNLS